MTRTLLHVLTDWPGHRPGGAATVAVLVAAGADVDARFTGPRLEIHVAADPPPSPQQVTGALWAACHGGHQPAAAYLLARGADLDWVGYGGLTPWMRPGRPASSCAG